MKRINVDSSIISAMSFQVFVPVDPEHCFDSDLHNIATRDWAVPGEMLSFYVMTSPSVLQLDALTFSPYLSKKTVRSRRSTVFNNVVPIICTGFIELAATTTYHRFKSMKPFRLESGHGIYPMCVKIPNSMSVPFFIDVFIPRQANPITRIEMRCLLPFTVTWTMHVTPVSVVAQFNSSVTLRGTALESLEIEDTHAAFVARRESGGEDVASNVEIQKPQTGTGTVCDDDTISSVFIIKPLTEVGASLIANNTLQYMMDWRYKNLRFTSHFNVEMSGESLGFALLLPPVAAEVMRGVTVPMRITNVRNEDQNLDLVFEGGPIQPAVQRVKLPELAIGESCTIDVSLLPLVAGYHRFSFWAETKDGTKIQPLFPTYIRVVEPSE